MLKGAQGAGAATQGGGQFGRGLGAMMGQKGGPAGKIGLKYTDAGLGAKAPNMQAMLQGLPQGQQQRPNLPTQQMNPLLQMLLQGGM